MSTETDKTKASPTPGPWTLDPPELRDILDADYHAIYAGDGSSKNGNGFGLTGYISIADARLIASAPDLLAAAKAFVEPYVHLGDDYLSDEFSEDDETIKSVLAVRAAIRKAEGG